MSKVLKIVLATLYGKEVYHCYDDPDMRIAWGHCVPPNLIVEEFIELSSDYEPLKKYTGTKVPVQAFRDFIWTIFEIHGFTEYEIIEEKEQ